MNDHGNVIGQALRVPAFFLSSAAILALAILACGKAKQDSESANNSSAALDGAIDGGKFEATSGFLIVKRDGFKNAKSCIDTVSTGGSPEYYFTYDSHGRLIKYGYAISGNPSKDHTSYTYDSQGRVSTATTGEDVTTYSYSAEGLLTKISTPTGGSSGILDLTYDDQKRPQAVEAQYPNGTANPSASKTYNWAERSVTSQGKTETYRFLLLTHDQKDNDLRPELAPLPASYQVVDETYAKGRYDCTDLSNGRYSCSSKTASNTVVLMRTNNRMGSNDEQLLPLKTILKDSNTILTFHYNAQARLLEQFRNGDLIGERTYDASGVNLLTARTATGLLKCEY